MLSGTGSVSSIRESQTLQGFEIRQQALPGTARRWRVRLARSKDGCIRFLRDTDLRSDRVNDGVILVLSEHSVGSDWVEKEVAWARKREKEENREILCPVAVDDTWKSEGKAPGFAEVLLHQVRKKWIADFSKWQDDGRFEETFERLLRGLKTYYAPE